MAEKVTAVATIVDGEGVEKKRPGPRYSLRDGGLYNVRVPRTPMLDVFRQTIKRSRLIRLEQILMARCGSVQVLLENVQDPHNGATCIRTADAFGLSHLHAVEKFVPFSHNAELTSYSELYVELKRYSDCHQAVTALKDKGFTLIAVSSSKAPFLTIRFTAAVF